MELFQLVYISKITPGLRRQDIKSIMASSHRNNHREGLTGLLFLDRNYFLQFLEGDRNTLSRAIGRIWGVSRHQDMTLVDFRQTEGRQLAGWSTALIGSDAVTQALLLRHGGGEDYTPFTMPSEDLVNFTLDLVRYLSRGELTPQEG